MSDITKSLFYIAIIPDPEICSEVKAFKTYTQAHFDSGWALRSPAHITLEPPFKWELERIDVLETCLVSFTQTQLSFFVELHDFDVFPPKVIFVNVLENPVLNAFQNELKQHLRSRINLISDRPDRPYHPHVTVAFKDLRKSMFPRAWAYFSEKEYRRIFKVNRICLLEHNGEAWEEKSFFDLEVV